VKVDRMRRRRFSEDPDPGETHHDVAGDILHALGKGFLIGSAGIMLGAILGIHHLATIGLWTLGAATAMGAGCVVGSALVRNAGCDRREWEAEQARQRREIMAIVRSLPVVVDGEAVRLSDEPAGYVALIERQREREVSGGKGV
jgi:hypothetical protein